MNTEYTLQATKRDNKGTSSSKKIRKNNGIPAVVYGDKNNNNILSFLPKEFESWKLLSVGKNGAGINYRKFSILSYITTSNALRNF